MRIRTFSTETDEFTLPFKWDLAFHGEELDDRGRSATMLVKERSKAASTCLYDIENPRHLTIDSTVRTRKQIEACFPNGTKSVAIEATTLDLVEILDLLRAARDLRLPTVDLLYAEPISYQRDAINLDSPWSREFSLSQNRRFEGVPGFVADLSAPCENDTRFVAFLGYEGARLEQACEQVDALTRWPKTVVFGIPGYAPGWEMNALANNVAKLATLEELSVRYCAAASVTGALGILRRVHSTGSYARTVVAPLGTKPHSIATALFLIENCSFQEAALIWDHPTKSPNRSSAVRRWHVFRVTNL